MVPIAEEGTKETRETAELVGALYATSLDLPTLSRVDGCPNLARALPPSSEDFVLLTHEALTELCNTRASCCLAKVMLYPAMYSYIR